MKSKLAPVCALSFALVGCATSASPLSPAHDGAVQTRADDAGAPDLDAPADLSARPITDAASPVDLRRVDLIAPRDLSPPPDLTPPPLCNPVTPTSNVAPYTSCGTKVNCLPSPSGATSCVSPTSSSGTEDAFCGNSLFNPSSPVQSDCAAGYLCVNVGPAPILNIFSCEKFCRVGSDADCAGLNSDAGTYSCGGLSPAEHAGTVEIGVCLAN
ncbi:MAG: hypothetical protein ACHQ17_09915 [Polyangia bacterium]